MEDFQKISRRDVSYKKHNSIPGFVPNCSTEIWWDTSIIENCDYYTTEMPYQDPMFWFDRKIIIFICSGGTDPSCISNGAICRNKEAFSNVRQYSYTTQKV